MNEQQQTDRQTRAPSGRTPEERAAARARRRQKLRRRRLVALGALVGIVVVLVLLIMLVARSCGGGDGTAGASAGKPSPKPTALRTPTAAAPLRLAAYGESVGGGLLYGLNLLTEGRRDIAVHRYVKVASGLTRPDYFDWPAYLKHDIDKRKHPFDAVALMFGANDGQDIKLSGKQLDFGTRAWKAMYSGRVGDVMDLYLKRGVKRVYWVGMPRMGNASWFNKRMEFMNGVYKEEAAKRAPQVEYVDAWTIVDAPAKTFQAKYRQYDKVHLTIEGGLKVAEAVLAVVAPEWHMRPFK